MSILILGLVLFFGIHSLSVVNESARDRLAARLGDGPWKGVYSIPAGIGLAAIVWGYGQARLDPVLLYAPPIWLRHAALVLLVPVFPLFVSTYFPGRISAAVRHPTLVATLLWAAVHLLANGSLADALLFGAFLLWAVAELGSMARRTPRVIPKAPPRPVNDLISIAIGLALYGAFLLGLHRVVAGVPLVAL